MADFRMRSDCRKFFRRIQGADGLRTLFDAYYLCFMIGVASGHRNRPNEGGVDAPAFVDDFPRPYDQQQRLLLGLMIVAEMRRARVDASDRDAVNVIVNDISGVGGLTAAGVNIMNGYASGGFDILMERYDADEPLYLEDFLPRYLKILDAVIGEGELAAAW